MPFGVFQFTVNCERTNPLDKLLKSSDGVIGPTCAGEHDTKTQDDISMSRASFKAGMLVSERYFLAMISKMFLNG